LTSVIDCEHVTVERDGRVVLEDISVTLEAGDFVALIGPNGAGKSTLLAAILGLIPLSSGTIRLFGEAPERGRLRVGYVPQQGSFRTDFPVRVAEMVAMGAMSPGWRGARKSALAERHVTAALERCGIPHLATRAVGALSGGERQRALIARALAVEPELLILDEPTASIDPSGQEALFDLLGALNREMSVLVVSHDLGLTTRYAKSVWCLNRTLCRHDALELDGDTLARLYGFPLRAIDHRPDRERRP
jgi:zinc transport system ATP-binding protein